MGCPGVRRQCLRVGDEDDPHRGPLLPQPKRRDEGIASVVAGAGQDEDGAGSFHRQRRGPLRRRGPGPGHERLIGMGGFQITENGAAQEECHDMGLY